MTVRGYVLVPVAADLDVELSARAQRELELRMPDYTAIIIRGMLGPVAVIRNTEAA